MEKIKNVPIPKFAHTPPPPNNKHEEIKPLQKVFAWDDNEEKGIYYYCFTRNNIHYCLHPDDLLSMDGHESGNYNQVDVYGYDNIEPYKEPDEDNKHNLARIEELENELKELKSKILC